MNDLLAELFSSIAGYCDFMDHKSLRVTSKLLSEIAAKYVFEHFHMALSTHCMHNLKCLAESHFATHLK